MAVITVVTMAETTVVITPETMAVTTLEIIPVTQPSMTPRPATTAPLVVMGETPTLRLPSVSSFLLVSVLHTS